MPDSCTCSQTVIEIDRSADSAIPDRAIDCGARRVSRPDQRHTPPHPTGAHDLLERLSARVLLDRMHTPVLGLDHDGAIVYANPSSASLLGYRDAATLRDQTSPALLAEHSLTRAVDCVAFLRNAGDTTVDWSHAEGFPIHTTVTTLLLRATEPMLLIAINDLTELLWMKAS